MRKIFLLILIIFFLNLSSANHIADKIFFSPSGNTEINNFKDFLHANSRAFGRTDISPEQFTYGHSPSEIFVSINGAEAITLETALGIENSLCGSEITPVYSNIVFGHTAEEIIINESTRETLQQAINSGSFCPEPIEPGIELACTQRALAGREFREKMHFLPTNDIVGMEHGIFYYTVPCVENTGGNSIPITLCVSSRSNPSIKNCKNFYLDKNRQDQYLTIPTSIYELDALWFTETHPEQNEYGISCHYNQIGEKNHRVNFYYRSLGCSSNFINMNTWATYVKEYYDEIGYFSQTTEICEFEIKLDEYPTFCCGGLPGSVCSDGIHQSIIKVQHPGKRYGL